MIVITGAAGFIGSHFCGKLNTHSIKNIILVDDFKQEIKRKNWENLEYVDKIQREDFFQWAEKNAPHIDCIFHLGARTDYFSTNNEIFEALNTDFSQRIWSFATLKRVPLVYASSYLTNDPRPLSLYAKSKYIFDKWVEKQQQMPPFWAGLKFFQVYGKNEIHKAENASNVYKIYKEYVNSNDCMGFTSHVSTDNTVIQDYIYVNDVTKVLYYFLNHAPKNGIYEVGTGFARPLQAIVDVVNKIANCELRITRDLLQSIGDELQIFQADLSLLRKYAYKQAFLSLEQGVKRML
jgi:ADP-L-glycero-D-manno-heptose 6-epimerase